MTKQLKPGGEIIICEKDVRYIVHRDAPMPLEYPNCLGHMHHMTLESTINICNKVGLKITDYGYVKRRSALRHFFVKVERGIEWKDDINNRPVVFLDSKKTHETIMKSHGW